MQGKGCRKPCLQINSTLVICSCSNFSKDSWAGTVQSGCSCVWGGRLAGISGSICLTKVWYFSMVIAQVRGLGSSRADFPLELSHWPRGTLDLLIHLQNLRIILFPKIHRSNFISLPTHLAPEERVVCAMGSLYSLPLLPIACRRSNFKSHGAVRPLVFFNQNLVSDWTCRTDTGAFVPAWVGRLMAARVQKCWALFLSQKGKGQPFHSGALLKSSCLNCCVLS